MSSKLGYAFEKFLSGFPLVQYPKHKIIQTPGEVPAYINYIKRGTIKLYSLSDNGSERLLVILKKGELFPVRSILPGATTSFYGQVMSDLTVRQVPINNFLNYIRGDTERMRFVVHDLIETIAIRNNRIYTLGQSSISSRLLSRLEVLSKAFGIEQKDGTTLIGIPLTHQDLADSINSSRESISRELNKLRTEGVIGYQDNLLVILDMKKFDISGIR